MARCKGGATRSIHTVLQNAIVATINDPDYVFALPTLSAWESAVSYDNAEKQRLEFIGDAVMHLSVALYLYQLFPDGTPGLYTNIRSAVNTNATFTHLMVKTGAHDLPFQSHSTKAAADSFEVIVAALYMERGFPDVCAWVQEQYAPLIAAARRSYDECVSTKDHGTKLSRSTKRSRSTSSPSSTPLRKKISSRRSSPTFMARLMVKRMKSKGKVKLCLPTKKAKSPHGMRLRGGGMNIPETQRPSPLVIDLTVDSNHDEAPSHVTQAFRSSLKSPSLPPTNQSDSSATSNPPLSRLDTSRQTHQASYKPCTFYWPPKEGTSTRSPALPPLPHRPPSPLVPHPTPKLPAGATSNIPQPTCEISRRPGLSLPQQSNNTQAASGTHENPIIIDDSDTE